MVSVMTRSLVAMAGILAMTGCRDESPLVGEPEEEVAGSGLRVECTEAALRAALASVAAAGGGRITFGCANTTVPISATSQYVGDRLILDGEDRNITFAYAPAYICDVKQRPSGYQASSASFLVLRGNDNTLRNVTLSGFPEGVQFRGARNVADGLKVTRICDEAVAIGAFYGTGDARNIAAPGSIIRNSYFNGGAGGGGNKGLQVNVGSLLVENSTFININLPVRGVYETQRIEMRGNSFPTGDGENAYPGQGPQFSSVKEPVIFEKNTGSQKYGILLEGSVQAIIRDNTFTRVGSNGRNAILLTDQSRARVEGNTITGFSSGPADAAGVRLIGSARADLGGGALDIGGTITPSTGGNVLRNAIRGAPYEVRNETAVAVSAKQNRWDHATAAEVVQHDVSGAVEVDPVQ